MGLGESKYSTSHRTACSFTSAQCWGYPPPSIQLGSTFPVLEQTLSWILPCFVPSPAKPSMLCLRNAGHTQSVRQKPQPAVRTWGGSGGSRCRPRKESKRRQIRPLPRNIIPVTNQNILGSYQHNTPISHPTISPEQAYPKIVPHSPPVFASFTGGSSKLFTIIFTIQSPALEKGMFHSKAFYLGSLYCILLLFHAVFLPSFTGKFKNSTLIFNWFEKEEVFALFVCFKGVMCSFKIVAPQSVTLPPPFKYKKLLAVEYFLWCAGNTLVSGRQSCSCQNRRSLKKL